MTLVGGFAYYKAFVYLIQFYNLNQEVLKQQHDRADMINDNYPVTTTYGASDHQEEDS